ncbi:hypothetical protein SAMN04487989_10691 [Bizionia echini]|uniref:Glycine dehydrogenase n=1 Tax=Bizionia echini TaxID=649333 RepID=A0A1I5CZA6_9FLAO|nr:hypothetical protein [Bizionia echini]SFN91971.1 hypothetical protein SAMN04487989_10691 [Bizionia echini]
MKKRYLFITCEEAQHICDKAQYNEATNWEKFKLTLRYFWCHITRSYVKRNSKLSESVKNSKLNCLKTIEREQIKAQFTKELSKQERK